MRISTPDLPDEQRNEGRIVTLSNQSGYHAQQEFEGRAILADNDAVEHVCSTHYFSGVPTRSASRVVSRVRLRTGIGEKVRIDFRLSVSGMSKRGIQAALCHRHGYLQKHSKPGRRDESR